MKKLFLILISLIIFPIFALELKTNMERASYVLGVSEGKIMKENFSDIENPRKLKIFDLEAYLAGISDSYYNKNFSYKSKELLEAKLKFFKALGAENFEDMAEQNPRASYSMGIEKGYELKEIFGIFVEEQISLNLEIFKLGLKDAFLGRKLSVKEEEIPQIIKNFLNSFQKATSKLIKQLSKN